jgi:hypothetical protein
MSELSDQGVALPVSLTQTLSGAAVSRLHRQLRAQGASCADVGSAFLSKLGVSPTRGLGQALLGICADADRSGRANAYHNPAHSREVGVNWFCLALLHNGLCGRAGLEPLSRSHLAVGLCAAFAHDLDHDGVGNTDDVGVYRPFWLESLAADRGASLMGAAGAGSQDIAAVRCAILLTDPRYGYPVLEASLTPEFATEQAIALRPEFACLGEASVRLMAAILRDADLMPSAAMPASDHDARTREMLIEQGRDRDAQDRSSTDAFLSGLVGGRFLSPPGRRFQSDLDHLKALNAARGDALGGLAAQASDQADDGADEITAALVLALGLERVIGPAP